MNQYEAPTVRELGSLADLTQTTGPENKVGTSTDLYSSTTPLVGSIIAAP